MAARTFEIDAPFGYKLVFQTKVPGTLSLRYSKDTSASQPDLTPTHSEPPASPAPQNNSVEGSESDSAIKIHIPITPPRQRKNASGQFDDDVPIPGSPALTEIIPDEPERTSEEIVVETKSYGIKVRDFALEPRTPSTPLPAPSVTDPRLELYAHDSHLYNAPVRGLLHGPALRRLLDLGWVTQAEATALWPEHFWALVKKADATCLKIWTPLKTQKPTLKERREVLHYRMLLGRDHRRLPPWLFPEANADVEMASIDEPMVAFGQGQKRIRSNGNDGSQGTSAPVATVSNPEPVAKRRRLLSSTASSIWKLSANISSQAGPSSISSFEPGPSSTSAPVPLPVISEEQSRQQPQRPPQVTMPMPSDSSLAQPVAARSLIGSSRGYSGWWSSFSRPTAGASTPPATQPPSVHDSSEVQPSSPQPRQRGLSRTLSCEIAVSNS